MFFSKIPLIVIRRSGSTQAAAKKVCVIGAGPCGLPAIKSCLEEGLDVVCFECRDKVGGLWNYTEKLQQHQQPGKDSPSTEQTIVNKLTPSADLGTVMRTTISNLNKEAMSYSDFPAPRDFPMFMHHSKALQYYQMYAEHFRLLEHIRFRTEVVRVAKPPINSVEQNRGAWEVTWKELSTGKMSKGLFDGVMVCVGHDAVKYQPDFEGQEQFEGKIIHSHDYRSNEEFVEKNIVIIGCGNSACDIACDLSDVGKQIFMSTRRGFWTISRLWNHGLPWDLQFNTRLSSLQRRLLPSRILTNRIEASLKTRFDHNLYGLRPNYEWSPQIVSINDHLPSLLACGAVRIKPEVRRLTSRGVEFSDGSKIDDVDVIICATGYSFSYPFIDHPAFEMSQRNDILLYKMMFAPQIQPQTLAVIGCVETPGSAAVDGEMQSRYAARVFKGLIDLPGPDEMRYEEEKMRKSRQKEFLLCSRQLLMTDYSKYMDSLASEIGCKPPGFFRLLLTDPALCKAIFTGLMVGYQYRLVGPGAWSGARQAILGVLDRLTYPLKNN